MSEPEKKVSRRRFLGYIGAGAAIAVLAGLAGYFATRPPAKEVVTVEKTHTVTATASGAPGREKLVVWGRASFAPAQMYWANDRIREWASKAGVDVEITWIPVADQFPKLSSAVAAGAPPDVLIGFSWMPIYAERGLLEPIDEVVNELGKDDIMEAKLKQGTVGGKIYSISTGYEMTWLHVRKDLAEKAGVMDLFPFKSVDDLYTAAEALSKVKSGVYGIGIPLGSSGFDAAWTFNEYFYGFGGAYATGRGSKYVVIGKEPSRTAAKKAFEVMSTIWKNKWTPPDSTEWVDVSNNLAYLGSRVAMTSNPMSIYYAIMTGKQELAPVTMLVPDLFPIDLGDESCWVFKGSKADLAKDLIVYLFKDKESYRKGWCEASWWYNLPIFKSQLDVISENWNKGKYQYWGIDPKEALGRIVGVDIFYPIVYSKKAGKDVFQCGVISNWYQGWGVNEMVYRAVVTGEDWDKVIDDVQAKLEDTMKKEYGS
ncbi:MAG: extracellular solute-binding protein [Thaumarchaeota archaeon]|nr:extracellular solute-binding protein [Nitrososphaerota archaeon]